MESRVKLFGHAIHPMLIVFPLGLLAMAVIFDVLAYFTGNLDLSLASYWMVLAGVVGGLAAAVFGTIDFLAIPEGTRARRIGLLHGVGNVIVTALFAASWWMRMDNPGHVAGPYSFGVALVAVLLATVTGWMGGELVDRLGVAVDRGAHLNAPSSLSGRPAYEDVMPAHAADTSIPPTAPTVPTTPQRRAA
jgi:uncharacterized membrane protein